MLNSIRALLDQLNDSLLNDSFDVVYIASPNSLHLVSKDGLSAGKHVILEPAVTNHKHGELIQTAKINVLSEAARNYHEAFAIQSKTFLQTSKILGQILTMLNTLRCLTSLLCGDPNAFRPFCSVHLWTWYLSWIYGVAAI